MTKTFTADAVLRLVDQGKVALTDPMSMYVDDLPYGDQVTIQDLLAMRSGMYDFGNDTDFFNRYLADPTLPWTAEDALAIVRAHASEATPPNQATAYVNTNFVVLGLVIEQVTGQTVEEHLNGLISELGLTASSYPSNDDMPEPYVHGYYSDGKMAAPAGGYRDVTAVDRGPLLRRLHHLHRPGHGPLRRAARHRLRADAGDVAAAPELHADDHYRRAGSSTASASPSSVTGSVTTVRCSATATWCSTCRATGDRGRHGQRSRRDRRAVPEAVGRRRQVALPRLADDLALTPSQPATRRAMSGHARASHPADSAGQSRVGSQAPGRGGGGLATTLVWIVEQLFAGLASTGIVMHAVFVTVVGVGTLAATVSVNPTSSTVSCNS